MGGEAPVFARMTEPAAGDVEATDFCGHGGDDERSPKSRRDLRLSPGQMLTTIKLTAPGFRRVRAA